MQNTINETNTYENNALQLQKYNIHNLINQEYKQYGELHIEPFKKDGIWYGKFPLPTIDSNGYREEPLVLREQLSVFGENYVEYKNLINDDYFGLIVLRIYHY